MKTNQIAGFFANIFKIVYELVLSVNWKFLKELLEIGVIGIFHLLVNLLFIKSTLNIFVVVGTCVSGLPINLIFMVEMFALRHCIMLKCN